MDILLIDQAWYDRYLKQIEKFDLSAESIEKILAQMKDAGYFEIETSAPNIAIIPVLGPLTKTKDPLFSFFARNNTTYDQITQGVLAAEGDDSIEYSKLRIHSPGGEWTGLTDAVQAIAGAKKPIYAEVVGMATSAAYILASQTDRIYSTTNGNDIGGLGVVTRQFKFGDEKTARSSNAPNKNPDIFTKSGEKEMIKQLDAVEKQAFQMVSEGRSAATGKKITDAVIKKDFGRGASMLADEALKKNMIDEILQAPTRISNAKPATSPGKGKLQSEPGRGSGKIKHEVKLMETVEELMAEFPQLCAQLVDKGRKEVWSQVKGHLTLAETSGATEFCLECLKDQKDVQSPEVFAGYAAAGMKKTDLKKMEDDNPDGELDTDGGQELSEEQKEAALLDGIVKHSRAKVRKEA